MHWFCSSYQKKTHQLLSLVRRPASVMMHGSFRKNVLDIVRRIPAGIVLTYGDVARQAGNPRAARAVGAILRANHDPAIPCHRVIRRDGTLGGYNRGIRRKIALLKSERAYT